MNIKYITAKTKLVANFKTINMTRSNSILATKCLGWAPRICIYPSFDVAASSARTKVTIAPHLTIFDRCIVASHTYSVNNLREGSKQSGLWITHYNFTIQPSYHNLLASLLTLFLPQLQLLLHWGGLTVLARRVHKPSPYKEVGTRTTNANMNVPWGHTDLCIWRVKDFGLKLIVWWTMQKTDLRVS